jgi:hypothetical protein
VFGDGHGVQAGHVGDPHHFVGGRTKVDVVDTDPELLDEAEAPGPDRPSRQRRPERDDHVDLRPAADQARFELALPDDLDHDSLGNGGRPVLRHLGPGVVLGEPLLADNPQLSASRFIRTRRAFGAASQCRISQRLPA